MGTDTDNQPAANMDCPTDQIVTHINPKTGTTYADYYEFKCSQVSVVDGALTYSLQSAVSRVGGSLYTASGTWKSCAAPATTNNQVKYYSGSWVDAIKFQCYVPTLIVCGDGVKQGLEECDDGRPASGDGCSSTCTVEPGYTCSTPGSLCTTTALVTILGLPPIGKVSFTRTGGLSSSPSTLTNLAGNTDITITVNYNSAWTLTVSAQPVLDGWSCPSISGTGGYDIHKNKNIVCTYAGPTFYGPFCQQEAIAFDLASQRYHNPTNENCYVMLNDNKNTMTGHDSTCIALGGRLVDAQDAAEVTLLSATLGPLVSSSANFIALTCANTLNRCMNTWTSATVSWYTNPTSTFVPAPASSLLSVDNYVNPANPSQMELCMTINNAGKWQDDDCMTRRGGICKIAPMTLSSSGSSIVADWTGVTYPGGAPVLRVSFILGNFRVPLSNTDVITVNLPSFFRVASGSTVAVSTAGSPTPFGGYTALTSTPTNPAIYGDPASSLTVSATRVNGSSIPGTAGVISLDFSGITFPFFEPNSTSADMKAFKVTIRNAAGRLTYATTAYATGPAVPVCGDGVITPPETCDVGDVLAGDGCSPICKIEAPVACTDGNALSGDGCSSSGAIEPGYVCPTAGQLCKRVMSLDPQASVVDLDQFGGNGGSSFSTKQCPVGTFLVGFTGSQGWFQGTTNNYYFRSFGLRCVKASFNSTGHLLWSGSVTASPMQVSASGVCTNVVGFTQDCPSNQFVTGIRGPQSDSTLVSHLRFTCGPMRFVGGALASAPPSQASAYLIRQASSAVADSSLSHWRTCAQGKILSPRFTGRMGTIFDQLKFSCSTPTPVVCGDGAVNSNFEACDDGNAVGSPVDGCSPECVVDGGWSCSLAPSVCALGCGDGDIDAGEGCDDGNLITGDGCDGGCQPEPCFDGNTASGDGCSSAGLPEPGYRCLSAGKRCSPVLGAVTAPPTVNLTRLGGAANASLPSIEYGDTCAGLQSAIVGLEGYMYTVPENGGYSTFGTMRAACANTSLNTATGALTWTRGANPPEPYRGSVATGGLVTVLCPPNTFPFQWKARTVQSGQRITGVQLTCAPVTYQYGYFAAQTASPTSVIFGTPSTCCTDPGWTSAQFCPATGPTMLSSRAVWTVGTPTGPALGLQLSCAAPRAVLCGDGLWESSEPCEDGGTASGDGCSGKCQIEAGFSCSQWAAGNATLLSVCTTVCGDLTILGSEMCDDGNAASGDGCSASCQQEAGYCCLPGVPGPCTPCPILKSIGSPGTQGGIITIAGLFFTANNASGSSLTVTLGPSVSSSSFSQPTPCANATLDGDSQIMTCVAPPGTGVDITVAIVLEGRASAALPLFSYAAPVLTAVSPAVIGTGGAVPITVYGLNFGDETVPAVVTVGRNTCRNVVHPTGAPLLPHTTLVCDAPAGEGNNLAVTAFVGFPSRGSDPLPALSYYIPTIVGGLVAPPMVPAFAETPITFNLTSLAPHLPLPHVFGIANPSVGSCTGVKLPWTVSVTNETVVAVLPALPLFNVPVPAISLCYQLASTWYDLNVTMNLYQCGSGKLEGVETCDDGNAVSGDGCSGNDCTVENGWLCVGTPSVCAKCGDGIKVSPLEVCDDGNRNNNDGCNSNCTAVDPGFTCVPNAIDPRRSSCFKCGNGKLESPEECDDSNNVNGDCCSSTCTVEPNGCDCRSAPGTTSRCHLCGNGVWEVLEACDDNNLANGDGCSSSCQPEPSFVCFGGITSPSACQSCGNGLREGSEQCDDGNLVSKDGCSDFCFIEVGIGCTKGAALNTTAALTVNGTAAAPLLTAAGLPARGVGDKCFPVGCGDGEKGCTEDCDDGNLVGGDGCNALCKIEPLWSCFGSPSICQLCGNGKLEGTEACDDGNLATGDGCSPTCEVYLGWTCVGPKKGKSVCTPPVDQRTLTSAFPMSSPTTGGTSVVVFGAALDSSLSAISCIFGGIPGVPASPLQPNAALPGSFVCVTPPLPVLPTSPQAATLSLKDATGVTIASEAAFQPTFLFYPPPVLSALDGQTDFETAGGQTLTLIGTGFLASSNTTSFTSLMVGPAVLLVKRNAARRSGVLGALALATEPGGAKVDVTVLSVLKTTFVSATKLVATTPFRPPSAAEVAVTAAYVRDTVTSISLSPSSSPVTATFSMCKPGYVSPNLETRCTACAPGTSQGRDGQKECLRCDAGFYAPYNASTACLPCPSGSDTSKSAYPPTSLDECLCSKGYYDPAGGGRGVICRPCKAGGVCEGAELQPYPTPGYWQDPNAPSAEFLPCKSYEACPGGSLASATASSAPARVCGIGYKGIRCGACSPGYYSVDTKCVPCPKVKAGRFALFAVALLVLTLVAVMVTRSKGKQKQMLATFTVATAFANVLGIVFSLDLRWPERIRQAVHLSTFFINFNMDIIASDCAVDFGFDGKIATSLGLPVFFAVLLGSIFGTFSLVVRLKASGEEAVKVAQTKARHLRQSLTNAFILILSVIYIVLCQNSLMLFDCGERGPTGLAFLDSAPDIACYSPWWFKRLPIAVGGVIFYVIGIPVGLGYLAWRSARSRGVKQAVFLRYFGSFSGKYRPRYPAWETVVMLRKFLIVLGKIMFSVFPVLQALFALAAINMSLGLHLHYNPMLLPRTNKLETVLLSCCTAVLLSGVMLGSSSWPEDGIRSKALVGFVLTVITGGALTLLIAVIFELWMTHTARPLAATDLTEEEAASILDPAGVASAMSMYEHGSDVPQDDRQAVCLALRLAIRGRDDLETLRARSMSAFKGAEGKLDKTGLLITDPATSSRAVEMCSALLRCVTGEGLIKAHSYSLVCHWLVNARHQDQKDFWLGLSTLAIHHDARRGLSVPQPEGLSLTLVNRFLQHTLGDTFAESDIIPPSQLLVMLRPLLLVTNPALKAPIAGSGGVPGLVTRGPAGGGTGGASASDDESDLQSKEENQSEDAGLLQGIQRYLFDSIMSPRAPATLQPPVASAANTTAAAAAEGRRGSVLAETRRGSLIQDAAAPLPKSMSKESLTGR